MIYLKKEWLRFLPEEILNAVPPLVEVRCVTNEKELEEVAVQIAAAQYGYSDELMHFIKEWKGLLKVYFTACGYKLVFENPVGKNVTILFDGEKKELTREQYEKFMSIYKDLELQLEMKKMKEQVRRLEEELRRVREENEELKRKLEETKKEKSKLEEEIRRLRELAAKAAAGEIREA